MPKPAFRTVMQSLADGEVVLPVLRNFLYDPSFPAFNVQVDGMDPEEVRVPDGWFHPSRHPLWTERQLYYYLQADAIEPEVFELQNVFAIISGLFWHRVIQHVGLEAGLLKENDPTHCSQCEKYRAETPAEDLETMANGHMDGDLTNGDDALEIKTMNPGQIDRINSLQDLATIKPGYYAQAIEYLRLSGRKRMIVILISPAYPFSLKEIHIVAEPAIANRVRDKYLYVRDAVEKQQVPMPCCAAGSKESRECPVRAMCPIGMM
jgi:hypothetical protein